MQSQGLIVGGAVGSVAAVGSHAGAAAAAVVTAATAAAAAGAAARGKARGAERGAPCDNCHRFSRDPRRRRFSRRSPSCGRADPVIQKVSRAGCPHP